MDKTVSFCCSYSLYCNLFQLFCGCKSKVNDITATLQHYGDFFLIISITLQLFFICLMHSSKWLDVIKLPPTKKQSTLASTAKAISCSVCVWLTLSGSISTAKDFCPNFFLSTILLYRFCFMHLFNTAYCKNAKKFWH